jgi:predicted phosphodiesterase
MRCIVISDCHGSPHLITNALRHSSYNPKSDRLIFAGDIVDIGFDAGKCIDILLKNNAELLWGNHDLAIILNKQISPQNKFDSEIRNRIIKISNLFKVAAMHDEVLITHAGLSQTFYDYYYRGGDIVKWLNNNISLKKELWQGDSPLWYRPVTSNKPEAMPQVAGHTPPGWIERSGFKLNDFYTVDPYCRENFGPDRYRYAIIQDNKVQVIDSNDGVD